MIFDAYLLTNRSVIKSPEDVSKSSEKSKLVRIKYLLNYYWFKLHLEGWRRNCTGKVGKKPFLQRNQHLHIKTNTPISLKPIENRKTTILTPSIKNRGSEKKDSKILFVRKTSKN